MIAVGQTKFVPATVREPFGGASIRTRTQRVKATVIFVNSAHGFYVAEWDAPHGKRRETFYTGMRRRGDNLTV